MLLLLQEGVVREQANRWVQLENCSLVKQHQSNRFQKGNLWPRCEVKRGPTVAPSGDRGEKLHLLHTQLRSNNEFKNNDMKSLSSCLSAANKHEE